MGYCFDASALVSMGATQYVTNTTTLNGTDTWNSVPNAFGCPQSTVGIYL